MMMPNGRAIKCPASRSAIMTAEIYKTLGLTAPGTKRSRLPE